MRRALDIGLGAYALVCILSLIWPGYAAIGNRVEPFVLGLPLSLAWNVGWALVTFGVLLAYHFLRQASREDG